MNPSAVLTPEMEATHADRPTSHVAFPFRFVANSHPPQLEYYVDVKMVPMAVGVPAGRRKVKFTLRVEHVGNYLGVKVQEAGELYGVVCQRIDGLLAAVDKLTTDNVMLRRQVEEAENRIAGMKAQMTGEIRERDLQIANLQRGRDKGDTKKKQENA